MKAVANASVFSPFQRNIAEERHGPTEEWDFEETCFSNPFEVFSETIKAHNISKAGVIGNQDIGGIFFDVGAARNFYVPEWIDSDNEFSPEICNAVSNFAIPIQWF